MSWTKSRSGGRPAYCCVAQLLFVAMLWTLLPGLARATDYLLYFLGGQSNMDGYGKTEDLPEELEGRVPGVMIFHGNPAPDGQPVDGRGVWAPLRPGHGVGFQSDGTQNAYSDRFGVELTFGRRLRELQPQVPVAIIKYSRGGTSIDQRAAGTFGSWDPDFNQGEGEGRGINQYDHFLATLRHATSVRDIDGDGQVDRLLPAGIVWMQGESDAAFSLEIAEQYETNLRRLMELIRAAMRWDDLPVVIGRISDSGQDDDGKVWTHGDVVRRAQAAFVASDPAAALVTSTDAYSYSDRWHYDSAGYLDLGRQFADAMDGLRSSAR